MNKYFVIGMLTAGAMFAVYDIFKTIEVKRENKRNKKIRQKKYDERLLRLKGLDMTKEEFKTKFCINESNYIQGVISLEEYEKNKKELDYDKD